MNLTDDARAVSELLDALATDDSDAVAAAATRNVWPLYTGHVEMLTAAIEHLPVPLLEKYPVLRALHPMTPVLARGTRSFTPFLHREDEREMSTDEFDIFLLVQMVAFRFSGDIAAAHAAARHLAHRIDTVPSDAREHRAGPLWYYHYQMGSTWLAAGDSARAQHDLTVARQLGRISALPYAERLVLGRIALAYAVRGSLDEAAAILGELRLLPAPSHAHLSSSRAAENGAAALVAAERLSGNTDSLLTALEPADSIESTWPCDLLARARALTAAHRPDDALETIRLTADAHPTPAGSFAADVVLATTIDALCAGGDLTRAERLSRSGSAEGPFSSLAIARFNLHAGRADTARAMLRAVAADYPATPGLRAEATLLSAWAQWADTGRIERSAAHTLRYLAVQGNSRRLFAGVPRPVIDAALAALESPAALELSRAVAGLSHTELESRPVLTPGELRILRSLAAHESIADVAAEFRVSRNTVKSQLRSVYRKLGCSSRASAIATALRWNLLIVEATPPLSDTGARSGR